VKGYGNPESFAFNNLMHLDMASGLPEKRKSEFFKDFGHLNALTTGCRGNDVYLILKI